MGPFISAALGVFSLVSWVGRGLSLGFQVRKDFDVAPDSIRLSRWGVGGIAALAEFLGAFDPTDKATAVARVIAAVLDGLLVLPYAVIRIVRHTKGDDRWLIGLDVVEFLSCELGYSGTVCSSTSTLIPPGEPATTTAKSVSGF